MGKTKSSGTKAKNTAAAGYSPYHALHNTPTTLRQESTGNKMQKPVNAKSMLKLDHIKNLALWPNGEASLPSLAAFFGNRFTQTVDALTLPPHPNLFSCQRCQSILQPGFNCTVRIEKQQQQQQQQHKHKNNVVYLCHFCSHPNLKRGTPNKYGEKPKPPSKESSIEKDIVSCTPERVIDDHEY